MKELTTRVNATSVKEFVRLTRKIGNRKAYTLTTPVVLVRNSIQKLLKIEELDPWASYKVIALLGIKDTYLSPKTLFYVYDKYLFTIKGELFIIPQLSSITKELLEKKIITKIRKTKSIEDFILESFYYNWTRAANTEQLYSIGKKFSSFDFFKYRKLESSICYRGIRLSPKGSRDLLVHKKTITLKNCPFSSWTTDKRIAYKFITTKRGLGEDAKKFEKFDPKNMQSSAGIVIAAKIKKSDVFINMNLLYNKVKSDSYIRSEKEVIVKGPGVPSITPKMIVTSY